MNEFMEARRNPNNRHRLLWRWREAPEIGGHNVFHWMWGFVWESKYSSYQLFMLIPFNLPVRWVIRSRS